MNMKTNNGTIIELTDSKAITNILNNAFLTVALQFGFTKETVPFFPAFIGADIIEKQLINGLKMFGYKIDEQIVGCVGYSYHNDQIYLIERLAVLPNYRHLGIGKKLMEFIEIQIKEKGGKTSEVHVVEKNEVLIEWYKKLNFKLIRTDKFINDITKLPFGLCVMNKELL